MAMTKLLDEPLEKQPETKWLDKKARVNTTCRFEIKAAMRMEQDVALELLSEEAVSNDVETGEFLRLNKKMQNELIDHYGNRPSGWIGQWIELKFTEFVPKPGSKVSAGVQTDLVWPQEESIDESE